MHYVAPCLTGHRTAMSCQAVHSTVLLLPPVIDLFSHRTPARKGRRHVLYRHPFPSADLGWMDALLLGQFRKRHLPADRFKRNFVLELGL